VVFGPTAFLSRSLFIEVGGFDEALHYGMDTDLWVRFMMCSEMQSRLNRYCWAFRMHELSKTAEFNDHKVTPSVQQKLKEEYDHIVAKTNYSMSRFWRFVHLLWRGITFSQAKAVYNSLFLCGKNLGEL
jgi:hypothetical protein